MSPKPIIPGKFSYCLDSSIFISGLKFSPLLYHLYLHLWDVSL